ncbi:MAG: DUF600 family protein [Clostridia bacterium]|nr:DUF600 family protein [Clostridia bacterium]
MEGRVVQQVVELISDFLPQGWKRMAFYAGYTSSSYEMKFFVDKGKGYIDCFKIYDINSFEIFDLFESIDNVLMRQRKELKKKDKWTVFTLLVDSKGKFNVFFDYQDIEEISIEYFMQWQKKYL